MKLFPRVSLFCNSLGKWRLAEYGCYINVWLCGCECQQQHSGNCEIAVSLLILMCCAAISEWHPTRFGGSYSGLLRSLLMQMHIYTYVDLMAHSTSSNVARNARHYNYIDIMPTWEMSRYFSHFSIYVYTWVKYVNYCYRDNGTTSHSLGLGVCVGIKNCVA